MQIKRFEAASTRAALDMVKKEMGENAVILSTRTVNPLSGHRRGHMEVVAAMDYDIDALAANHHNPVAFGLPRDNEAVVSTLGAASEPAVSEAMKLEAKFNRYYKSSTPKKSRPANGAATSKRKPTREEIEKWRRKLISRLRIKPLSVAQGRGPAVLAMVGTTGAGKTTTAAKLAAWFSIRKGLKVTLLSLDCYRIGATEQLRTYARIMRLPCDIALHEKELDHALTRHGGQDLILIDTAGRSPYDRKHLHEMTTLLSSRPAIKPYLVVSATTKKEDLKHIATAYAEMAPAGQIITKIDETRAYAALCQHLATSSLPVSALCTGQRVPEDYIPADRTYLATLFTRGWNTAHELKAGSSLDSWAES